MTNKPKVVMQERDLSIDDQMFKLRDWPSEDGDVTEQMLRSLNVRHNPMLPPSTMIVCAPTSPDKSIFNRHMRSAFPGHFVVDEVHQPYKPLDRSHLHEHQALAMSWLDNHPAMRIELDACGNTSMVIDTESYFRQGINAARLPLMVRPLRGMGFGGHMDRDHADSLRIENLRRLRNGIQAWEGGGYLEYPSIGGQFKLFSEHFGVNIISDEYVAPPKPEAKDWDKNARHWYKAAMGGKPMMNMALAMYRLRHKDIYNPEFDWENQWEARRRLGFIKHVNVGTVGHIDWGNNRLIRPRPQHPGRLADAIRAVIANY